MSLQNRVNGDLEVLLQRQAALDMKMQSLQASLCVYFQLLLIQIIVFLKI